MPPATRALADSHEERIQRIEAEQPELTAQVAIVALQQRHLAEHQERLGVDLGDKMDSLRQVMVTHAQDSARRFDGVLVRVDTLEQSKKQLEWLKKLGVRIVTPLALVAGALLAQFGEALFNWFVS